MIIIDIIKTVGGIVSKSRRDKQNRDKRVDNVVSIVENWEMKTGGIMSFAEALQEIKTEQAVMRESIDMIKSFFGITNRRGKNTLVKTDRRKTT